MAGTHPRHPQHIPETSQRLPKLQKYEASFHKIALLELGDPGNSLGSP